MKERELSSIDCIKLSDKIKSDFFIPINTYKTTVFLCGANRFQKDTIRFRLAKILESGFNSLKYQIVYPEDIFDELLYSSKNSDLLSLENLLAESVDVVVIITESPGSLTELGAFANDTELRKKIVCIMDKKFKKNKSFINQGPAKLIKKESKEHLIFINPKNVDDAFNKTISSINKIKKNTTKNSTAISLLQLDNFLLPAIYLLEPIKQETLVKLAKTAMSGHSYALEATISSLAILTKNKNIELTPDGYKLTDYGYIKFQKLGSFSSRIKTQDKVIALDNLRLEFLNLKLRNKKLRI